MTILFDSPQVRVFQSALFQTNSTVVTTDDLVLVVDPNWLPLEIAEIRQFVETQSAGKKPVYLLFTHSDYDHIIGYHAFSDIAESVIASHNFVENTGKETTLQQIRDFDDEYYIERNYPIEYPSVSHVVSHDGQTLTVGSTELTFFNAVGHNPDGIFTVVNGQYWIAGDYLCGVEFPYIYHSSIDYEKTLHKTDKILQTFDIQLLVSGHGAPTTEKLAILQRQKDAFEYIDAVRESIRDNLFFDFDAYIQYKNYRFPRIMRKFHEANLSLMRGEIFN
jgi:glyoxylase-like metal-dependent hydrolase (beta-lactamase superfamily II)